ncbi:MAG: DinB family protein [Gemmatimonadota bacterium]
MQFDPDACRLVLEKTPGTLHTLLQGLPDSLTRTNEGTDTFSPFDVVGHLIDGEETDWILRARIILDGGPNPVFEPYDRFRHYARNADRTLASLLDEFSRLRATNLSRLGSWRLTPELLDRRGIHPTLGDVTLRQLLAAWVVHDLGHVAQISRVIAKQFGEEVGPWMAFLPVLTDHERPRS